MNEKSLKKRQKEDLATKRILVVFLMAAVVLWGMSKLYDMMTYGSTFTQGQIVNNTLLAVSGIAAVVLAYLYFSSKKRGTAKEDKVIDFGILSLCAATIAASSFILAMDFYNGMHVLYVFLPVVAVLYLVYHVYERQFFTFSTVSAVSITAAYWSYSNAWERLPALVLAGVLCLFVMGIALLKGGRLQEALLGKQFDRKYTVLVYAALLATLLVAAMLEGKIALVLTLCMVIYLLAAAVYYTIKAM